MLVNPCIRMKVTRVDKCHSLSSSCTDHHNNIVFVGHGRSAECSGQRDGWFREKALHFVGQACSDEAQAAMSQ